MTALAVRYGVSRKTAYEWVERYEAEPATGLGDAGSVRRSGARATRCR